MNPYATTKGLKYSAKAHLTGNYNIAVSTTATVNLIGAATSMMVASLCDTSTVVGLLFYDIIQLLILLLMALFSSGQCFLYLNMCCNRPIFSGMLFYEFKNQPEKAIKVQGYQLITYIIVSLPGIACSLLTLVTKSTYVLWVGRIALLVAAICIVYWGICFSQCFYLIHDFPNYSAKEIVSTSCKIMEGHKLRYFRMMLSFIPLYLVALLTLGIGFLWVVPYMQTTKTEFFLDMMSHKS